MNSSHSPAVTSRSASSNGASHSAVAGGLVVESEVLSGGHSHLDQTAFVSDPTQWPGVLAGRRPGEPVGGAQRVG